MDIGNLARRILKEAGISQERNVVYYCTIEKEGEEYIAQFPDMPNIVTCGFSREEAIAMAKEALDGCLEADISQGNSIPKSSFKKGHPSGQIG